MKKTLALIFVFALCFGLFVGCGNTETASDNGSENSSSSEIGLSTVDVAYLDKNGEAIYSIVSAEGSSKTLTAYLYKKMRETLGTNIKNITDEQDGTDAFEILVGETNRPETKQAREYLMGLSDGRVNDYIICTIGKKIVIYGVNFEALNSACKYFSENFIKAEGISGGIKHVYLTPTEGLVDAAINQVKLGRFVFVKQRFNEAYVVSKQIEDTKALLLEKTGYLLDIVEDHSAATDYEIIIGNANRDGVAKITDKDEYSIKVSGKKVYLNGGSPAAKAMAVSEFAKMLTAGAVTDADSVTGSYTEAVEGYDKSKYYTLAWSDDFDEAVGNHETGIDLSKWRFGTDGAQGHNNRKSVRSQSKEHLYVSDGMLNFYAAYDDQKYYGFKLVTSERMSFRYGVLEMSAILPHGDAFWVSLWANSPNVVDEYNHSVFFTEVNVIEMFGNSGSGAANLHGWIKNGTRSVYNELWAPLGVEEHWSLDAEYWAQKKCVCPEGKFNDGLHTFTYIWDEDSSSFACDGNVYFTISHSEAPQYKDCFTQPISVILSQATCFASGSGRNMPDDDPRWTESNNFQIDYVHVYQYKDSNSIMEIN